MPERRLTVLNIVEEGRYGGPQQRIVEVAAQLRSAHEIETIVLLPAIGSERFQEALTAAGVQWRAIRLHRLTRDPTHLGAYATSFIAEVLAMRSVIRSVKPDVVHCNGAWQVKGMLASWLVDVPRVWHMNDSFMPTPVRVLFDLVYRTCRPDGVAFSARRSIDYYFGNGKRPAPRRTWVLPPPVDTARFDPAIEWPFPYADRDFEGTRVLSVGNVNPVKGYELLIRAAHELNRRGYAGRLRFYVAGSIFENQRVYHGHLRTLASSLDVDNLMFMGERRDIPALMRHADIFVCTSWHETGPMVMWEALSMNKPAVSTDVGDVRTLFETHQCGLVATDRNPGEIASLVEQILRHPSEATAMAGRGRLAVEGLDVGHAATRHAECYRQATGGA